MIEQIKRKDCKGWMDYPYKDDPLLEYVNVVADHFWYGRKMSAHDPNGFDIIPSHVPAKFVERYLNNMIDLSRLPMYLNSIFGKQNKLGHKPYLDYINNSQQTITDNQKVESDFSKLLKIYHLDISKFWYLCICIKDFVEGQTKKGCLILNPSRRNQIKEFANQLKRLQPQERNSYILTNKKIKMELFLKVNNNKTPNSRTKSISISDDGQTLALIKKALDEYLEKNKGRDLKLDARKADIKSPQYLEKDKGECVKVSLFCKYLKWFLQTRDLDREEVELLLPSTTSKNLLITRMVYFTGLSMKQEFLDGNNDYAITYSSGYKDIDLDTGNIYYRVPNEAIAAFAEIAKHTDINSVELF